MTSEWFGEIFKGDSADTCGGKFPLVSMGGRAEGLRSQTQERQTPSALAEFFKDFIKFFIDLAVMFRRIFLKSTSFIILYTIHKFMKSVDCSQYFVLTSGSKQICLQ